MNIFFYPAWELINAFLKGMTPEQWANFLEKRNGYWEVMTWLKAVERNMSSLPSSRLLRSKGKSPLGHFKWYFLNVLLAHVFSEFKKLFGVKMCQNIFKWQYLNNRFQAMSFLGLWFYELFRRIHLIIFF